MSLSEHHKKMMNRTSWGDFSEYEKWMVTWGVWWRTLVGNIVLAIIFFIIFLVFGFTLLSSIDVEASNDKLDYDTLIVDMQIL